MITKKVRYLVLVLILVPSYSFSFMGTVVSLLDDVYKASYLATKMSKTEFTGILIRNPYAIKSFTGLSKYNRLKLYMGVSKVPMTKQPYYLNKFNQLEGGDKILIDAIKNNKNLDDVLANASKINYMSDKFRTINYTLRGFINDTKTHRFVDGNGHAFYAKISEVVDLSRTVKMPYLGSVYRNTNAAGFERDAVKFWKQYNELYPEVLSKNNLAQVNAKLSPMVDKQWIKYNPKHKSFKGETLEHHHLNNTNIAVGVPRTLHRGQNNKELMHVD